MTSILDAEDCWEIVNGDEAEPKKIDTVTIDRAVINREEDT